MPNLLYYGDNLMVLREQVLTSSVDLVYLDPPFNSDASYNMLFKSPDGDIADASIEAFDDTWTWGPAAASAMMDITESGNHVLHTQMQAWRGSIGENALMAYLSMIAVRLLELHRVLKPTGSLYLHCDPTASHYLKLILDAIFGAENFRSEIIWKRTSTHNSARRWGPIHDTIFFYSRSGDFTWNRVFTNYDASYVARYYRHRDEAGRTFRLSDLTASGLRNGESGKPWNGFDPSKHGRHWAIPTIAKESFGAQDLSPHGWLDLFEGSGIVMMAGGGAGWPHVRRYLDQMPGQTLQDIIDDIPPLSQRHGERLGYPTQKPIALLERIIAASSNPGDVILDPFCGCGTAVDAAQKLDRRWIGIDVTHLAIGLIEKRLREGYGEQVRFETIGSPRDLASALRLAADDPHGFQHWITLRLGGYPWMGGKKGGDRGIDGYFYYVGKDRKTETGVISVKAGGTVNPAMVRDLGRVMARDNHKLGLFLCAARPTKGIVAEAASHGMIDTEFGRFPALQTFTLADMFAGHSPRLPPLVSPNRRATRVETRTSHQPGAQPALL